MRFDEVHYNRRDIEEAILVPGRDQLIVDTFLEHVRGRKAVIFCVNVRHGETLASRFQTHDIPARSVSGRMPTKDRKAALDDFAAGRADADASHSGFCRSASTDTLSCYITYAFA